MNEILKGNARTDEQTLKANARDWMFKANTSHMFVFCHKKLEQCQNIHILIHAHKRLKCLFIPSLLPHFPLHSSNNKTNTICFISHYLMKQYTLILHINPQTLILQLHQIKILIWIYRHCFCQRTELKIMRKYSYLLKYLEYFNYCYTCIFYVY